MPVTRISPSDCSTVPRSSEPRAPTRPAASAPVNPSEPGSRDRLTDQVSTAVTTTGISIATAVTRTAEPTVAFGLKRMIRNAASYMSPSWSGRSAIAPGLWAAPSMPGCGGYGPGCWPGYWAARYPAGRTRAAGTAAGGTAGGTAGSGAAAASRAVAAGPHRGPAARRRWRPGEGRTRFPTPRHPLRAAARVTGFPDGHDAPTWSRLSLNLACGSLATPSSGFPRSAGEIPGPLATDLACADVSAKIVRLLRRVAGVRQFLIIESRLPMCAGGPCAAAPHPGMSGRPDPLDAGTCSRSSGQHHHHRSAEAGRREEISATRPTAGVGGARWRSARRPTGSGRTSWHETKDERDLWRDRRSASGSRPMTTR